MSLMGLETLYNTYVRPFADPISEAPQGMETGPVEAGAAAGKRGGPAVRRKKLEKGYTGLLEDSIGAHRLYPSRSSQHHTPPHSFEVKATLISGDDRSFASGRKKRWGYTPPRTRSAIPAGRTATVSVGRRDHPARSRAVGSGQAGGWIEAGWREWCLHSKSQSATTNHPVVPRQTIRETACSCFKYVGGEKVGAREEQARRQVSFSCYSLVRVHH
jgi:hypothetical protein